MQTNNISGYKSVCLQRAKESGHLITVSAVNIKEDYELFQSKQSLH